MSGSVRIACPMCGQPLDRGAVEAVHIEFSTLNACGRCGFGLDLRWRGRGSALAQATPDWVIAASSTTLFEEIRPRVPHQLNLEAVVEPVEALGIYARALRRKTPVSLIILMSRGHNERYSDTAVAIRSLEDGFQVQRPVPIWHISAHELSSEETQVFSELSGVYWRPCAAGAEGEALLELLPELLQIT